jgi:hypothetical protein
MILYIVYIFKFKIPYIIFIVYFGYILIDVVEIRLGFFVFFLSKNN